MISISDMAHLPAELHPFTCFNTNQVSPARVGGRGTTPNTNVYTPTNIQYRIYHTRNGANYIYYTQHARAPESGRGRSSRSRPSLRATAGRDSPAPASSGPGWAVPVAARHFLRPEGSRGSTGSRHGRGAGGGWDQSDKFVKIYISLNGVQKLPAENVQVNFTERSFDLLVKNLNGKNYTMTFNNLLKPISVEGSSRKIKTDMILVMCKKKREEKWDCLTQVEKESKEKEKAAYDTTDPSEGLMNILKKMYAEGDDEMKRTINKAWVESREKQYKGDIPMDI
uniref:Calcyclin binding protein n=1 Tax=Taeniopygia guttata TaxID=59729 RepID=A0A674HU19_TAEGU